MNFGGNDFFGIPNLSLGQAMFMAEAEGQDDMVNTRLARFLAALDEIGLLADDSDNDVTDEVNTVLFSHGIDPDSLDYKELEMIESALYL